MFRRVVALSVLVGLAPLAVGAQSSPAPVPVQTLAPDVVVPAGTELQLHLTAPISSDKSQSGDRFAFTMAQPIVVDGQTIVARDARGEGVLLLAGHAGSSGHEGDLTLRFDGVRTVAGHWLEFDNQRVEINGRNRKAVSFLAGFIPFAGYGSSFIRGSEVRIGPDAVLRTKLVKAAFVVGSPPAAPAPSASP